MFDNNFKHSVVNLPSDQTKTKSRQVHLNKTAVKTGLKSSEEAAVFGVTLIKKKKKTALNLYTLTLDID